MPWVIQLSHLLSSGDEGGGFEVDGFFDQSRESRVHKVLPLMADEGILLMINPIVKQSPCMSANINSRSRVKTRSCMRIIQSIRCLQIDLQRQNFGVSVDYLAYSAIVSTMALYLIVSCT